jgi:hypothetical protein
MKTSKESVMLTQCVHSKLLMEDQDQPNLDLEFC